MTLEPGAIDAVTFDVYGTLIDWEAGIRAFVAPHLAREAPHAPPLDEWMRRWEPIQFALLTPYKPYAEVLVRSFEETNTSFALPSFADGSTGMVRALAEWPPFPDTIAALRRIGRRRRLGVISNIDRALLAQTLGTLLAPITMIATAEDVHLYKPDEAPFRLAIERLGIAPARVLHAAFGWRYDLAPARALGLRTCWVNRGSSPLPAESAQPDLEVPSLAALAEWLG